MRLATSLLLVAGLAVAATAGCTTRHAGQSGAPAVIASRPASGSPTPSTTGAAPGTPGASRPPAALAPAPALPTDPVGYAQAAITAWRGGDTGRLASLTSPGAAQVLGAVTGCAGCYDPNWTQGWSTTVGGTDRVYFYNAAGDAVALSVTRQDATAAVPHAVTAASFDQTAFPTDLQQYAQAALLAWEQRNIARLGLLTGAGVATGTGHLTGVYDALRGNSWTFDHAEGAAGSLYLSWHDETQDLLSFRFVNPGLAPPPANRHHLIVAVVYQARS